MDSSIMTFVNHGCRGEYNVGKETAFDEFTVDPNVMPPEIIAKKSPNFSPKLDRYIFHQVEIAIEDIPAGDEILDNYLAFCSDPADWAEDLREVRKYCSGEPGQVLEYERGVNTIH